MNRRLVLASQSPRRRVILEALGIPFVVHPSDAPEVSESGSGPKGVVMANARAKADAVTSLFADSWILGSDTVVALGDRVFGKPRSMPEAEEMLLELQGKEHRVFTAVCLIQLESKLTELWCEETRVGFRPLTLCQIRDYLAHIDPLDKAGAYAIQEGGERIVSHVFGSLSNVVGLPLESVELMLKRHGVQKKGLSEGEAVKTPL